MKADSMLTRFLTSVICLCLFNTAEAGLPVWSFTPLTATTVSVPASGSATIQYTVTNNSTKPHTLAMQPIVGVTQLTAGVGICGNPFVLAGKASCVLSLQANGAELTKPVSNGPIVCQQGSALQCYRPSAADVLNLTQSVPTSNATISLSNSPLTLTTNGSSVALFIYNSSTSVAAENITADLTGTALDGNVTETGNTCATLQPMDLCSITFTPGGAVVPQTSFTVQGTNTNSVVGMMQIDAGVSLSGINPTSGSAAGGVGVTLTGVGLTGTTSITFDGFAASNVNVVNSTTVTAVTPPHVAGAVDVTVTTPSGSATLVNGYTYQATAVGQAAYGGVIACLNGGLNNLIASVADNSVGVEWGGLGITTNATSTTDGATNTATVVATLGNNGGTPYASQICANYEVDSQGNTPCEAGNTCYDDWFLPAGNNLTATGQLNCLYNNSVSIGGFSSAVYTSSTEFAATTAWGQDFSNSSQVTTNKNTILPVRCVRAFTP